MEDKTAQLNTADDLARQILKLSRSALLINLRFLDMALSQYRYVPVQGYTGTDGRNLFYDAGQILRLYRRDKDGVTRLYLHSLIHCICRHMFAPATVDRELWNLACDMATENVLLDLDIADSEMPDQSAKHFELRRFESKPGQLTAERIYPRLRRMDRQKLDRLKTLFIRDDHTLWYQEPDYSAQEPEAEEATPEGHTNAEAPAQEDADSSGELSLEKKRKREQQEQDRQELESFWKNVSRRMQMDLETISVRFGTKAGSLMQNLREVNREKYDYGAFLQKFAVSGESMVINSDEFDYIYYTYGLNMYGNMPLIEPLEYKQTKKIREFVIAIDTSGSVKGELVQKFVQKTYNILKQQETFFSRIVLHIIQCDAAIQEDVKITNQQEFDAYLANMKLHGMGGTDYRPVFEYVDGLIRAGEFTNLKGMIYFTDGFGRFPAKQPEYQTAFVFVNDELANPDVPVWAIKLILQSEDIEQ